MKDLKTVIYDAVTPLNYTYLNLLNAIYNDDMRDGYVFEPATLDDVLADSEGEVYFDAITSTYQMLETKARQIKIALDRVSKELNVLDYSISKPYMRLQTMNIAILFELSDGQTISVLFHNPDLTPKKVTASDVVISFKWILNKKDVTILVAPEHGKDINIRQVATRIMQIALANSIRFAKANEKRAETVKQVQELTSQIENKQDELEDIVKKTKDIKSKIEKIKTSNSNKDSKKEKDTTKEKPAKNEQSQEDTPQDTPLVAPQDTPQVNNEENKQDLNNETQDLINKSTADDDLNTEKLKSSVEDLETEVKKEVVFTGYDDLKTKKQREKANDEALKIVDLIKSNQLSLDDVTDEQKEVLSKYSGNGGGLVNKATKLKGSQYEYFTPKEVAKGMWDLLEDCGFDGKGGVLDPCCGTGIFSATAPKGTLMKAVELDDTSGTIAKAIFNDRQSTTISSFEEYASSSEDETEDAIITNIPFGDVTARGGLQFKDSAYQNESLSGYFILRALDKLKAGKLACFMADTGVISNKSRRDLRAKISRKAEFLGAYRLPNKIFKNAGADVSTDVMVFRKYTKEQKTLIEDAYKKNPVLLSEAGVMRENFIDGKYFLTDGLKNVLGETVTSSGKFGEVQKVVNDDSIANIMKLMRRFEKFPIDWKMLGDVDDTVLNPVMYDSVAEGDIKFVDGRQFVFKDGEYKPVVLKGMFVQKTEYTYPTDFLSFIEGLNAVDCNSVLKDIKNLRKGAINRDQIPDYAIVPNFVKNVKDLSDYLFLTGFNLVVQKHVKTKEGGVAFDFLSNYPNLSAELKNRSILDYKLNRALNSKSELKDALKSLSRGTVWDIKDYTPYWKGLENDIEELLQKDLTVGQLYENALYKSGSGLDKGLTIEEFEKSIPDEDWGDIEKWALTTDGKHILRADDHYFGYVGAFNKKYEEALKTHTDEKVIKRLKAQLEHSRTRYTLTNIDKLDFKLTTPLIPLEYKVAYLNSSYSEYGKFSIGATASGATKVGFKLTNRYSPVGYAKALPRVGILLTTNSLTLGGAGKDGEKELIAETLNKIVTESNIGFDFFAKQGRDTRLLLEEKLNNIDKIQFNIIEDTAQLQVKGLNPNFKPHSYQSAFVRNQARGMGGICGFDVGLGKTFTALMTVQYLHSINAKRKTLFVVPKSTLSNWQKESTSAYTADVLAGCLFIGLGENKDANKGIAKILENKHNKIYMSLETFISIALTDETITKYLSNTLDGLDVTLDDVTNEDLTNHKEALKIDSAKMALLKQIKGSFKKANNFFENLGVDSLVIDEAHNFKNSTGAKFGLGVKGLSTLSKASNGALNANVKAWYVRGTNEKVDGVLCLTATPITNSPQEIYNSLVLAKGEQYLENITGTRGVDNFLNQYCLISEEYIKNIHNTTVLRKVFVGFNNTQLLRKAVNSVANIKTADDVKTEENLDIKIPDATVISNPIALSDTEQELMNNIKDVYFEAKQYVKNGGDDINSRKFNNLSKQIIMTGKKAETLASTFNFIDGASKFLLDNNLYQGQTVLHVEDFSTAEKIKDEFNELQIKVTFDNVPVYYIKDDGGFVDDLVEVREVASSELKARKQKDIDSKATGDADVDASDFDELEDEEIKYEFIITIKAVHDPKNKTLTIYTTDYNAQSKLYDLADKHNLIFSLEISTKLKAFIENIKKEKAMPRAQGGLAKQIVFCDYVGMHKKLQYIISTELNIPKSKIAIVNSNSMGTKADNMQDLQDGYNANSDKNVYEFIIANKKAEVGINLQMQTQAIHHLTIGWTPDSIHQRNGRGVRQGNILENVNIYFYEADGTFDKYKRMAVNDKSEWISQLVNGDSSTVQVAQQLTSEELDAIVEAGEKGDAELARIKRNNELKTQRSFIDVATAKTKIKTSLESKIKRIRDSNSIELVDYALDETLKDFKEFENIYLKRVVAKAFSLAYPSATTISSLDLDEFRKKELDTILTTKEFTRYLNKLNIALFAYKKSLRLKLGSQIIYDLVVKIARDNSIGFGFSNVQEWLKESQSNDPYLLSIEYSILKNIKNNNDNEFKKQLDDEYEIIKSEYEQQISLINSNLVVDLERAGLKLAEEDILDFDGERARIVGATSSSGANFNIDVNSQIFMADFTSTQGAHITKSNKVLFFGASNRSDDWTSVCALDFSESKIEDLNLIVQATRYNGNQILVSLPNSKYKIYNVWEKDDLSATIENAEVITKEQALDLIIDSFGGYDAVVAKIKDAVDEFIDAQDIETILFEATSGINISVYTEESQGRGLVSYLKEGNYVDYKAPLVLKKRLDARLADMLNNEVLKPLYEKHGDLVNVDKNPNFVSNDVLTKRNGFLIISKDGVNKFRALMKENVNGSFGERFLEIDGGYLLPKNKGDVLVVSYFDSIDLNKYLTDNNDIIEKLSSQKQQVLVGRSILARAKQYKLTDDVISKLKLATSENNEDKGADVDVVDGFKLNSVTIDIIKLIVAESIYDPKLYNYEILDNYAVSESEIKAIKDFDINSDIKLTLAGRELKVPAEAYVLAGYGIDYNAVIALIRKDFAIMLENIVQGKTTYRAIMVNEVKSVEVELYYLDTVRSSVSVYSFHKEHDIKRLTGTDNYCYLPSVGIGGYSDELNSNSKLSIKIKEVIKNVILPANSNIKNNSWILTKEGADRMIEWLDNNQKRSYASDMAVWSVGGTRIYPK